MAQPELSVTIHIVSRMVTYGLTPAMVSLPRTYAYVRARTRFITHCIIHSTRLHRISLAR